MKTTFNVMLLILCVCAMIFSLGFVMKFYWLMFMAGWGVL